MSLMFMVLMGIHYLGDWRFQPTDWAKTKKVDKESLHKHVVYNVAVYLLACALYIYIMTDLFSFEYYLYWFSVNWLSHYFIDKYLPSGKDEGSMIDWMALDQFLHLAILFISSEILINIL